MSRNRIIAIVLAAIILVFTFVFLITEYREVSAYEWAERYNFEDEEPQGLYIFKEVTTRYFSEIPVEVNSDLIDTLNGSNLYIQFVPRGINDEVVDTLVSIASAGNDVLIIGDSLNNRLIDTAPHFFEDTFLFDSTLVFNFTDSDIASDTNFSYKFHAVEFDENSNDINYLIRGIDWEEDQEYVRVAAADSLALMVSFPIGEGRIFYHVNKDLFYNYSYRQTEMFDYTQRLLAHFDPEHIYLLNPLMIYGSGNINHRNPLEFIMSEPALKAAYFLLILGTLLYVFFGGKRKQKIIPVMEKNENTSLEYIETVSQLFYQQDQHKKLVAHMKNIFFHKMQKKFFVAPDDPNYVKVLAKKSKISATELQYIIHRFKEMDSNFSFTSDELASLNQRLETVYKEIDHK